MSPYLNVPGFTHTTSRRAEKKKGAARQLIVDAVKEFAVRPNHIWSELGTEEWDGKRLIVPLLSARWSAMDGADDIIALEARTLRSDQKLIVKKDGGVNNTFWIAGRELKALVEAIEQDQKPKHEADPDGEAA